jgi:hypothetical protein
MIIKIIVEMLFKIIINSLVNYLGLQNKSQLNRLIFTESSYLAFAPRASAKGDSIYLQSKNDHSNSQIISALDQSSPN